MSHCTRTALRFYSVASRIRSSSSFLAHRLVHDFATHNDERNAVESDYSLVNGDRPRFSITLNGRVRVEEGALAERYRAIHLARNKSYSQFIVGPDIAIITVHLQRARVCDVNDRVAHFARNNGSAKWDELPPPDSPTLQPK